MPILQLLILGVVLTGVGWLMLRALTPSHCRHLSLGETVFASAAIGFYLLSWLAITLLELRRFTPAWLGAILLLHCAAMAVLWRLRRSGPDYETPTRRRPSRSDLVSLLPFVFVAALLPFYQPFEYILGGRDPGVYVSAGVLMARAGAIPFNDPQVDSLSAEGRSLFIGEHNSHGIITTERLQGFWYPGRSLEGLVSQGLHLFPAWIGLGTWLCGYPALLWFIPFIAAFSLLSVYYFTARFAGTGAAVIAVLLLAVSPVQIYFSRYPVSEMIVQALLWSALFFFQLFVAHSSRFYAALAGIGTGLALLARIDSILLIVPVCLVAAYYFLCVPAERRVVWFLAAFAALTVQSSLHIWFVSRPYVLAVANALRMITTLTHFALPGFVIAILLVYVLRHRARRLIDRCSESRLLSAALGILVVLFAAYVTFYRPSHPHGDWDVANAKSFLYFSHFLGPVATVVFVLGFALLLYDAKSRNVLFTFLTLTVTVFYFYRMQIQPEMIWAMRRFLPVVWPAAFVIVGFFLHRLWLFSEGGFKRLALRAVSVGLAAALTWHTATTAPLYFRLHDYEGAVAWVDGIAKQIADRDVILFEPRFHGSLQTLSLPLWSIHRKNVFQFIWDSPDPAVLEKFVDDWRSRTGGRVFLALQKSLELASFRYGARLVSSDEAAIPMLEQVVDGYPKRSIQFPIPLKIYEVIPAEPVRADFIDIGAAGDDLLISGFSLPERDGETTFRWSTYKAGVFLPGFNENVAGIEIRLTQGPRPESLGRAACTFQLDGTKIGAIWPTASFETYRLEIPEEVRLRAREGRPIRLFFRASAFMPSQTIPGSTDSRVLGVAVDWVKLVGTEAK